MIIIQITYSYFLLPLLSEEGNRNKWRIKGIGQRELQIKQLAKEYKQNGTKNTNIIQL